MCCLSVIARHNFRRTVLIFKKCKDHCISIVYLLVLCVCLSMLTEKMCRITHFHMIKPIDNNLGFSDYVMFSMCLHGPWWFKPCTCTEGSNNWIRTKTLHTTGTIKLSNSHWTLLFQKEYINSLTMFGHSNFDDILERIWYVLYPHQWCVYMYLYYKCIS